MGEAVGVFAMGSWYPGAVVKIGAKRVTVEYVTGSGAKREKAITTSKLERVRPFGRADVAGNDVVPALFIRRVAVGGGA